MIILSSLLIDPNHPSPLPFPHLMNEITFERDYLGVSTMRFGCQG